MSPTPLRINVVFLYVCDLESAARFYAEVVGFGAPVVKTREWVEFALAEGTHFALHLTTPEALSGGNPQRNTVQFSIVVEDLNRAYEEMSAAGVAFQRAPEKGHGFELAEFLDPEGNQIRLIEMK